MKILLFTPTYRLDNGQPAIKAATRAALAALDTSGHEVTRWLSIDAQADKHANVPAQYLRARARALDGGFDALMIVEHDMIPPTKAMKALAETDAPVVYGVYVFRHGTPLLNITKLDGHQAGWLSKDPAELRRAVAQVVYPCAGLGFGCVLIRRAALERCPFQAGTPDQPYPDTPFAHDCLKAGIAQAARLDVRCGHITETGEVLWPLHPDGTPGLDVAVKVLAATNAVVRGELLALYPGQCAHLPGPVAERLAAGNYIAIIPEFEGD